MDSNERENKEAQPTENAAEPEVQAAEEAAAPEENTVNLEEERAEPSPEERLLYMQAEFENQKKRLLKEQDLAIRSANERFIRELLGIVDLFDRALVSGDPLKKAEQAEVKNFLVGIEMTHKEMVNLLGRFGVELIGKPGEVFNPEHHEAISQVDAAPEEVGKVVQVVQKGCLLNQRLLEPAKVIVGKAKEAQ